MTGARHDEPDRPLAPGEHEVIEMPNTLVRKAGGFRASRVDTNRIDRMVARLIRNYAEIAASRLAEMRETWDRIRAGEGRPDDIKRLGRIAHDFKGEGGALGYPLVTRIGESLCLLVQCGTASLPRAFPVIEAHVAAIEAVVNQRVEGEGGEIGKSIVAELRRAVRKVGAG